MIVFLDLDGTCCDATERFKKAGPEPKERGPIYSAWLQRVQNELLLTKDKPVRGMRELAFAVSYWHTTELVYLTGRSEIYREVTQDWLMSNVFPTANCTLLMRPKKNRQGNGILKESLIKKYLGKRMPTNTLTILNHLKEAVIVIDDDYNGDIEEVCHFNGWTFLKARSGGVWK